MLVRRGLPHVADRLRAGGRLAIAFLGGSITWGGNASDIDRFSYRARTTDMIRTACPGVEVHSINAGVGGTGSDLAAFRLHEDVLRHRPDLVLVEFAVNDGGAAVDRNTAAMEGIVRHISRVLPDADICFVYALRKESLHEGGYAPIRANHERIADHYQLPSIAMGDALVEAVKAGRVEWSAAFTDSVHPSDLGHQWYADAIMQAWPQLIARAKPGLPPFHREPALSPSPWDNAAMLLARDSQTASGSWQWQPWTKGVGWDALDGVLASNEPGSVATVRLTGTTFGVYVRFGDDVGDFDTRVDDRPWIRYEQATSRFWSAPRIGPVMLGENLPAGEHTLAIRVCGTAPKDSKGCWVRFGHWLYR